MGKVLKEIWSIVLIIGIIFAFRSSILNWYVIPSSSLVPTLKVGDHIVVNKLSYGFMLPFMETQMLSWDKPQRGDIVVFQGPDSEKNLTLIKRVVGLPGDKVTFTNGVLTINGVVAKETLQEDRTVLSDLGRDEDGSGFNLYVESGFSQKPHFILRRKWGGITESETQTWEVPPRKLLLIGDNRDNSADGRIWGMMDENRIYGRAFLISYSTMDNPNSWFPTFRSDRWFKEIQN